MSPDLCEKFRKFDTTMNNILKVLQKISQTLENIEKKNNNLT